QRRCAGPPVTPPTGLGVGEVSARPPEPWRSRLDAAPVVTTAAAASELLAAAVADDVGAVGAYVAAVKLDRDGHVLPANLRETIRYRGPTIELPARFGS